MNKSVLGKLPDLLQEGDLLKLYVQVKFIIKFCKKKYT